MIKMRTCDVVVFDNEPHEVCITQLHERQQYLSLVADAIVLYDVKMLQQ